LNRLQNQPALAKRLNIKEKLPNIVLAFDGGLAWKNSSDAKNSSRLKDIIKDADNLIALINKELKK